MPEFRIRMEFDVEVDDPSHVDAAFAAADWLQERARQGRLSYLVYEVAEHSVMHDGTQWKTVDLQDVQSVDEPDPVWPDHDLAPCVSATEHLPGQRHRWQECPTYHDDPPPSFADTCCGKCPGATCYVDQITGA